MSPLSSTKLDPVDVPASIAQFNTNDQSRALIEAFARLLRPNEAHPAASNSDGEAAQAPTCEKTPSHNNDAMKSKTSDLAPEHVGMSVGYKNLYSGKEDDQGRFQWQETVPDDILDPVEDAETQKSALLLRYVKVYSDPRKTLGLHSVVVQSPLLKEALETILAGYPGVTVGLQRPEFSGKFEPLIHRFSHLESAIDELKNRVGSKGIDDNGPTADPEPLPFIQITPDNEKSPSIGQSSDSTAFANSSLGKQLAAPASGQDSSVSTHGTPAHVAGKKSSVFVYIATDKFTTPSCVAADKSTTPASTDDEEVKEVEVRDASGEQRDVIKLAHMQLLHECLLKEFHALLSSSQDMMSKAVMTYEHIWTLFQPGDIIFCREDQQEHAFELKSAKYGVDDYRNPVFWLTLNYVDYDGSKYGFKIKNANISAYQGTRPISSLTAYPLSFHAHKEDIKSKLIARGERIYNFAGTHYKGYDGRGWAFDQYGEKEWHSVKGRIIIDATGWSMGLRDLTMLSAHDHDYETDEYNLESEYDSIPPEDLSPDEGDEKPRQTLTVEQKLICTPLIRGYALKEKKWLNMFVNSIHDIKFNTLAFESLVLPENQKELILGFTDSQQSVRNTYDDVIEGKGRGIIILLCGPPGVGKTLTAESVSEHMRVPLFTMSAGDLGADSRHIESRLRDVLGMCTRWNAICLLDEAEIFLEARSLQDLERNRIVSVFLRTLEYHEGIMFLTTNLISHFDPAFQSRIHISLDYPALTSESRLTIWKNFLKQHDIAQANARANPSKNPISALGSHEDQESNDKISETDTASILEARTKPHTITERQMRSLSLLNVNGRQIKNILKTAQLLASRKAEPLKQAHITNVLEVTQHLHNHAKASDRTRDSLFA